MKLSGEFSHQQLLRHQTPGLPEGPGVVPTLRIPMPTHPEGVLGHRGPVGLARSPSPPQRMRRVGDMALASSLASFGLQAQFLFAECVAGPPCADRSNFGVLGIAACLADECRKGRARRRGLSACVPCLGAGLAKVTSICRAVHCSKPQSRARDALRDSRWRGQPAKLPGCTSVAGPTGWKLRGPDDHAAGNPGITPMIVMPGLLRDGGCAAVHSSTARLPANGQNQPYPPYGQPSRV
jgi:hypothetical protein